MEAAMVDLSREETTYRNHLAELSEDEGRFVVVQGDQLHGVYDTYEDALKVAYSKFGVDGKFLVKRVAPFDSVSYFTRDIVCPA